MKRPIIVLSVILFVVTSAFSQTGKVFDNLTLASKILDSERKYAVYLPSAVLRARDQQSIINNQ